MKKLFITLSIYLSAAFTASAQQSFTLVECREMALQNNQRLAVSALEKEKANWTAKSVRTHYLPNFSASSTGFFSQSQEAMELELPNIGVIPLDLDISKLIVADVRVEQPLYTGGKITSGYKMAESGVEIAKLNQRLTEEEVLLETDKAFWLCIQARELHKGAESYKQTVEEFLKTIENAQEVGLKTRSEAMKVKVQYNQAVLQLKRAENAIRLTKMNLCNVMGQELDSTFELSEAFSDDASTAVAGSLEARPEMAILNKQIELKSLEKKYIRADYLPQIGLKGSYNYLWGPEFGGEPLMGKSAAFSAMVSVSVPLFHWGEGRKKIRAAEKDIEIASRQREYARSQMTLEVQQAICNYEEAALEASQTLDALNQCEENMRVSRNSYDAGMETVADYLEAQALWRNAYAEHIVAKTRLEIYRSEYLKAVGRLGR